MGLEANGEQCLHPGSREAVCSLCPQSPRSLFRITDTQFPVSPLIVSGTGAGCEASKYCDQEPTDLPVGLAVAAEVPVCRLPRARIQGPAVHFLSFPAIRIYGPSTYRCGFSVP